jgi:hypothetical protein
MAVDCDAFSTYILQRTLNFDKEMERDRLPWGREYTDAYGADSWENFTGTLHTWDKVHVSRFNDDGCWEQMDEDNCVMAICDTTPKSIGWGMTRANYGKFRNEYKSPVFCLDQWDHFREAKQAINAIVQGLKDEGPGVFSDFMRLFSLRTADKIWVVDSSYTELTVTAGMFTNNCRNLVTGLSAGQTQAIGQLTMQFLQRHVNRLMMTGYFNKEYNPAGMITMFSDVNTTNRLVNENPSLFGRYERKDFLKGGSFYTLGALDGAGNYAFKVDMTPLRYTHIGGGVLQRVFPWENIATTIGRRPTYSNAYEQATYQLYHVHNRAARKVFTGSVEPIHPEMPFLIRDVMGRWQWNRPMANFSAADPCTGEICEYDGTLGNKGFWRMQHQLGVKTVYPEIEMWILAKRELPAAQVVPNCGSDSPLLNYYPYPYNCLCEEQD